MTKKSIKWKENDLISLKLRDNLYTIAQMLRRPYMRFFKISRRDGDWSNIDLGQVDIFFEGMIGNVVFQKLTDRKIKEKSVIPSKLPFQKYWIDPHLNFDGGFPFKGGKLIEIDPDVGYTNAPIIKENLSIEQDIEIIKKYELTNMWGSKDLAKRLSTYFDTGQDHNPLKQQVFEGAIAGRS